MNAKLCGQRKYDRGFVNGILLKLTVIVGFAAEAFLPGCMEDKVKDCERELNVPEERRWENAGCVTPEVHACALKKLGKSSCRDFESERDRFYCSRATCYYPIETPKSSTLEFEN